MRCQKFLIDHKNFNNNSQRELGNDLLVVFFPQKLFVIQKFGKKLVIRFEKVL